MPVIDLPDYTKGFEQFYCACATILGYMFFPDDTLTRLKYTLSIAAMGGKTITLNELKNETNPDSLRELGMSMYLFSNVDILNTFERATDTRITRGIMAGDILSYSIQIFHDKRIKEPSIVKAKSIVRSKYANCKTISGNTVQRSEIGNVWNNYKDVSHFWYAWRDMQGDSKNDMLTNPCPVLQDFKLFIGIADEARKIGQSLRAKRQPVKQHKSGCVLDKETVYTFPESYPIPPVINSGIPPLDDWSMEILKSSHKRC